MSNAKTLLEFAHLFMDLSPAQQEAAEKVIAGDYLDYEDLDPATAEEAYGELSVIAEQSLDEAIEAYRKWLKEQREGEKEEAGEVRKALHG